MGLWKQSYSTDPFSGKYTAQTHVRKQLWVSIKKAAI